MTHNALVDALETLRKHMCGILLATHQIIVEQTAILTQNVNRLAKDTPRFAVEGVGVSSSLNIWSSFVDSAVNVETSRVSGTTSDKEIKSICVYSHWQLCTLWSYIAVRADKY